MKIGFLLDGGLERIDGVQQYILSLGSHYISEGHEVRYIIAGDNPHKIDHVISLAKNVNVRFNGNALQIPLPASPRRVRQMIRREKFDVLHIQTPHSPLMGAQVVRYGCKSATVVGTFHILPYGWLSEIGNRLLGFALRRNLQAFCSFMSVSQPAAAFAKRTFHIESTVIPNMVDISRYRQTASLPAPTDGTFRMVFVGRLVPRKGCRQLLEALHALRTERKLPDNLHLDICSDGEMREELEQFCHQHDLVNQVTFHGYVSEEKKISLLQAADISVFPSLSGESFGIVLLEAMAAGGGVVLGGDNPGYRSVLSDIPESIITAHDVPVLAKQLHTFIENEQKRIELFGRQQEHVRQFDLPEVAGRIMNVYEACIKQRNS